MKQPAYPLRPRLMPPQQYLSFRNSVFLIQCERKSGS